MAETPWGDDGVDDSAYNDLICPHGYADDEECYWCDPREEDPEMSERTVIAEVLAFFDDYIAHHPACADVDHEPCGPCRARALRADLSALGYESAAGPHP